MEKAYKFRFYPTKTQIKILNSTFGCVRYVYNHFLAFPKSLIWGITGLTLRI